MNIEVNPDMSINRAFRPYVDQEERKFTLWNVWPNAGKGSNNMYDKPDSEVDTPCQSFQQASIVYTNEHHVVPVRKMQVRRVINYPVPTSSYIDPRWYS
jgi:hypothetical protein